MARDHSIFLAENFKDFFEIPGFPYLRLTPAFITAQIDDPNSDCEEQLLLALHCKSNRILIVSNKQVAMYEIPKKKTLAQSLAPTGLMLGLKFIPGVGELVEAGEKLGEGAEKVKKLSEWSWGTVSGKRKREKEEDRLRAAEGMPTKKEVEDVVWDLRKPEILSMILCYKDRILLENAFEWKKVFQAPLDKLDKEALEFTVSCKQAHIKVGGKKVSADFIDKEWNPLPIASTLIDLHKAALESSGWVIQTGKDSYTFKKFNALSG